MCLFLPGIRSSDLIGLLKVREWIGLLEVREWIGLLGVREWMGVVYSVSTQKVIKILEFCD